MRAYTRARTKWPHVRSLLSSPAPLAQLVEHSAVIAIAFILMCAQFTERSTVRTRHRAFCFLCSAGSYSRRKSPRQEQQSYLISRSRTSTAIEIWCNRLFTTKCYMTGRYGSKISYDFLPALVTQSRHCLLNINSKLNQSFNQLTSHSTKWFVAYVA